MCYSHWNWLSLFRFRTKTFINQRDVPIEVASASRLLCRLATPISTQITFSYPFKKYIDSRYVFTSIDTFSFCVFLFYCICLSELYQDRQRKTDELLWSLGVSNSEQMISWYLAIIAQAMFWSAINFVQLAPQIQSMASSVVLLWFCYSFVFFVTAIFALISSKFVKGCLTFLLAIFQMIFVWLVLFLWSELQDRIPYPSSKVVRMVILLHPIAQAKNMFLLIQSAEFSKLGVTFSTLGSYFNVPQQNFFGNTLETFATMLMLSMLASLLFLVDFESLAESILSRLFKRKANNSQINFREVHEECEMDSKKRAIVEVNRLSMKYPNGFQAITDVSFSIYEGEIVGLLGKNGAGKSTTMNIISGFHSASAGSVKICGIDLKENRKAALSKLSFCPQDDRFFYRLTVLEHLQLMCSLKGAKYDKQRCSRLLDILGLADKAGQKPRNLSGGQKRRVCIAMAYAANSPLIILDEPTSAVDAATRKTLWTFFQTQQKQNPNQAVILCTHFMQEADVLSQRIAVISDGFLRAIGSSSYLKSLFGVGYTFFYARKFASIVKEIVQKFCSNAQFPVKEDQACFQIATEYSSCLPMILDELDSRKIECSFNAATLENVFVSLSTSPAVCDRSSSSCRENDDNDDLREPDKVDTRNSDGFQLKSKFLGVSNKNLNWAYSQLRFAVLVDLLRIFIQNFKFLISFSIAFFLLPQILMMLCLLDDGFESSGNALKNGNITVSPFTLDSNPKIVLFGEAPDDQVSKIGVILERSKIELLKNVSEEEVMSRYKIHPTEVFNTYPFFLKFNDSHRTFDCLVNSHFSSSALMCITLLIQIYSSNKTVESLNIAADFFYNETGNGDVDMGEGLDENGKNLCRSAIFYYFAPVLYMFLLFFIIRTESRRNEQNLSPFLRANGAFPLFSLAVRVAGLFLLAFAFFAAIVVTTEERHFSLYSKTIPSYGSLGLIVLFCLAFVSFAVLIAKIFNSVLVQLSLTLIVYVIYSQIYIRKEIRTTLNDQSKWFYLLTYPGYLIPTGGIGFLNSFDQLSNKDALYSWLAQLTCYLTLVVLIESLIIRVLVNLVAEKLGLNRLISVTQHDTAVEVTKVHHTYYGLNPIRIILRKSCKALQGMNMRVKEGECYALLGVNGAGKSTMFEVLTGGIRLQKGQVCVFGTSVSSNPWGVMKDLGYCSQLDKCPGYLRAKTIVSLFGTLRGLSEDEVIRQMQFMAKVLDVESHLNKFLSGCSGGTKRKVSTMVAFIGFPKLVILDESTTGNLNYLI